MTDNSMADAIYIEPLIPETIQRIIEKEKPDSLLSTLGGQTGLTLSMELAKSGFLKEHNVRLLGARPETIDKAWVLGTSAKEGPFQILDVVGLKTAYEIVKKYAKVPSFLAPYNFKGMEKLLKTYIDNNKLGKSTGEGFYKYK